MTRIEAGLQIHLPTHPEKRVADYVELCRIAEDGGVAQVWVTDNLGSRSPLVVLTALGCRTNLALGTAVLVYYFRNPVEAAGALATLNEVMQGSELSVGVSRGNPRTDRVVKRPKPVTMMAETIQVLRRLLDGESVTSAEFPTVSDYFNLAEGATFRLDMGPQPNVQIYAGGEGPKSLVVGAKYADGQLVGPVFRPIHRMGLIDRVVPTGADPGSVSWDGRRRVAEIKISLSTDAAESRRFAARDVGHRVTSLRLRGFTDEEISKLGVSGAEVDRLQEAFNQRVTPASMAGLVTDEMVDAFYIAGDIGYCREQVSELVDVLVQLGFHQVLFSSIAADMREGLKLLSDEILPAIA